MLGREKTVKIRVIVRGLESDRCTVVIDFFHIDGNLVVRLYRARAGRDFCNRRLGACVSCICNSKYQNGIFHFGHTVFAYTDIPVAFVTCVFQYIFDTPSEERLIYFDYGPEVVIAYFEHAYALFLVCLHVEFSVYVDIKISVVIFRRGRDRECVALQLGFNVEIGFYHFNASCRDRQFRHLGGHFFSRGIQPECINDVFLLRIAVDERQVRLCSLIEEIA